MLLLLAIVLSIITLTTLVISPVIGIIALFLSKPLIDAVYLEPILFGLRLPELVGGLVPIVVFGQMLFVSSDRSLQRMPLKRIWIVYLIEVSIFSLFIVSNQGILSGANVFFRYLNGFVGFYMLQAFFYDDQGKRFKILLLALIVAGIFPMGVGVYQRLTGTVWAAAQAEGVTRYIGLYHDAFTVRAYSFQTILALVLYGNLYGGKNLFIKASTLAYSAVSTVVMIGAYSKAGIVSLAMWALSWTALQRKFISLMLMGVAVAVVGVYYASNIMVNINQLFHKEIGALEGSIQVSRTFAGRWYGWKEMISRWMEFDLLKKMFGAGEVATNAHNDYLQMLFHGGLLGLLIYLGLLFSMGLKIISNLFEKVDAMAVAALMLFLMWLVDTIGLVPSAYPGYQWFVWGIIGLSLRSRDEKARAGDHPDLARQTVPFKEVHHGALVPSPVLATRRRFENLLR